MDIFYKKCIWKSGLHNFWYLSRDQCVNRVSASCWPLSRNIFGKTLIDLSILFHSHIHLQPEWITLNEIAFCIWIIHAKHLSHILITNSIYQPWWYVRQCSNQSLQNITYTAMDSNFKQNSFYGIYSSSFSMYAPLLQLLINSETAHPVFNEICNQLKKSIAFKQTNFLCLVRRLLHSIHKGPMNIVCARWCLNVRKALIKAISKTFPYFVMCSINAWHCLMKYQHSNP